ncbi:MAG: hypothetical protein N2258_08445 [Brevinematales bacterium]|nr:hypothetical protein [Brevinematales bacterium]
MKRVLILLIALSFFVIGACDKKQQEAKEDDFVTQLLKQNDVISSTNTNIVTEENITEQVTNTNATTKVSEIDRVAEDVKQLEKMQIKDEGIEVKDDKKVSKTTKKAGTYIIVGNDSSGQSVSPRKFLKLTMVIVPKSAKAKNVNFYVYALTKDGTKKYMIYNVNNIEVINGQAQLTKFWNAKKIDGDFLDPGNYNIYVKFVVKDKNGEVIDNIERYWGSKDFYIKLY